MESENEPGETKFVQDGTDATESERHAKTSCWIGFMGESEGWIQFLAKTDIPNEEYIQEFNYSFPGIRPQNQWAVSYLRRFEVQAGLILFSLHKVSAEFQSPLKKYIIKQSDPEY